MKRISREKLPPLPSHRTVQQLATERCGDDGEDEQMEKFYALLDNIRAERLLFKSQSSSKKKRPRTEEPTWKPTFMLEDFEEAKDDHAGSLLKPGDTANRNAGETS